MSDCGNPKVRLQGGDALTRTGGDTFVRVHPYMRERSGEKRIRPTQGGHFSGQNADSPPNRPSHQPFFGKQGGHIHSLIVVMVVTSAVTHSSEQQESLSPMKHCRSDRSPKGPSYTFDDKTGKWRRTETQQPTSSCCERSRDRLHSRRARVAQSKYEVQGGRLDEQTEHLCSDSFSASGEEGLGMVSNSIPEQPLMTPEESMAPSPKSLAPSAPPTLHEHSGPCLICDVHLAGARLTGLEDLVEQMMQDHRPL